jgi:hypothetical protein
MRCAIGLRTHSGWAAAVALTEAPAVILRERIGLADPAIPGAKAPYHAAEKMPLRDAAAFLDRCEAASRRLARRALEAIGDRLRREGREPSCVGLLMSAGRPLPGLEATLASHALIHVGDGEHFRNALAAAADECGLPVRRVRERDVAAALALRLGKPPEAIQEFLTRQRRELGPPWAQDQKLAALAAWLALEP